MHWSHKRCEACKGPIHGKKFPFENIREFKEYVGCKIVRGDGTMKFTQSVLLQSFVDEFNLPDKEYETPPAAGQVLSKV